MKKQILAIAALLAVGALASCGGPKDEMKIGLLTLHDENSTYDKNFIDAFKAACKAQGVKAVVQSGIDESAKCTEAADNMVDDGVKAVFADSFGHETHLKASAEKHPEVSFGHATGTQAHTEKLANFQNAFASIYEGRYLAGVAAGMKLASMTSAAHKIGYVGAFPYAEVISGYTSFYLGVKSVVADVTMDVRFTNSWYDETAEKAAANALISGGCTLISQHADSWGAPSACETAGVPNVSYNGSTESQCPNTFVVSSRINWQPYYEACIKAVKEGKKITELGYDWTGTVDTGSVELSALGAEATKGLNIQAKLDEVAAELKAGTRHVFDCSTFTVNAAKADTSEFSKAEYITMDAEGHLTGYLADVDDDGKFIGETEAVKSEGGKTWFDESAKRSAPYFDIAIDGITQLYD